MDTGNQGIQTAVHCEKVISLLNHLRENHKDVSGLIKLQRGLTARRKALYYLKNHDFLAYAHILRVYGLTDLKSERGQGIHKENFHCKNFR
jgi:ribosomal protein S15